MKKLVYLIVLSIVLLASCNKDSDDNMDFTENFVGVNVAARDTCYGHNNGVFLYSVDIIKEDETTLLTNNLFGYGPFNVVKMDVINANEISINYTDIAGRIFTGTGIKTGNELMIDVVVDFPTQGFVNDNCDTVITYE